VIVGICHIFAFLGLLNYHNVLPHDLIRALSCKKLWNSFHVELQLYLKKLKLLQ
jgi:hypothetical protein